MYTIKQFEQISMNAWPALQTMVYDGWILRFADGVTRRSNSINPIYDSNLDIEQKIKFCEKIYIENKLPVMFKMTPMVFPSDLDLILERRGYIFDAETSLQTLLLNRLNSFNSNLIKITEEYNRDWLSRLIEFNGYAGDKLMIYQSILKQIKLKQGYLDLIVDKKFCGCGLGVIEDTFLGLFDIVVDSRYRNRGLGKLIVESLIAWGKQNGATTAYLQVMVDNLAALHLYEKIGFEEKYKYWYRIKHL
jgi:ribosomal protein S18 acetylase RimI-like enzyme